MLDPAAQAWHLRDTPYALASQTVADFLCRSPHSVELPDFSEDHAAITVRVRIIENQGWSAEFFGLGPAAELRAAAAAAYLLAWSYARVAAVREDGNPWSLDVDSSKLARGIVSFGEDDLDLVEAYFGRSHDELARKARRIRP